MSTESFGQLRQRLEYLDVQAMAPLKEQVRCICVLARDTRFCFRGLQDVSVDVR